MPSPRYKRNSTFVTGLKKEAAHLSSSAERESRAGEGALKRLSQLESLLDGVQVEGLLMT